MARLLLSAAAAAAGESNFPCFLNCTDSPVCWQLSCISSPTPLPIFPVDPPPADSVSVGISHKRRLIQSFLIVAASLLAFSFFSLLVFYFLLRRRRRLQQLALHQNPPPPPLDPNPADDLLHEDDGPHHIWYIRTVGLDDSVIKSIAATVYKAGDGLIEGGDCSVCLGEFREGETIKLLPKCTHAFHLSCIDTWLMSHVNCPLCRAPVVAPPPPPTAGSCAEVDGSLQSQENAQIEISQRETREECVITINSAAAESSSSSGQLNGDDDGEVQSIRRSVSMDSSSLGMLLLRAESESDAEEKLGGVEREIEVEGVVGAHKIKGKGVAECLGKQLKDAEMKRSMSSMSGRLFFSRYGRGRGRSASVLPL